MPTVRMHGKAQFPDTGQEEQEHRRLEGKQLGLEVMV